MGTNVQSAENLQIFGYYNIDKIVKELNEKLDLAYIKGVFEKYYNKFSHPENYKIKELSRGNTTICYTLKDNDIDGRVFKEFCPAYFKDVKRDEFEKLNFNTCGSDKTFFNEYYRKYLYQLLFIEKIRKNQQLLKCVDLLQCEVYETNLGIVFSFQKLQSNKNYIEEKTRSNNPFTNVEKSLMFTYYMLSEIQSYHLKGMILFDVKLVNFACAFIRNYETIIGLFNIDFGSIATKSEIDFYINTFPNDNRIALRLCTNIAYYPYYKTSNAINKYKEEKDFSVLQSLDIYAVCKIFLELFLNCSYVEMDDKAIKESVKSRIDILFQNQTVFYRLTLFLTIMSLIESLSTSDKVDYHIIKSNIIAVLATLNCPEPKFITEKESKDFDRRVKKYNALSVLVKELDREIFNKEFLSNLDFSIAITECENNNIKNIVDYVYYKVISCKNFSINRLCNLIYDNKTFSKFEKGKSPLYNALLKSHNNIYLYGEGGRGKTFSALFVSLELLQNDKTPFYISLKNLCPCERDNAIHEQLKSLFNININDLSKNDVLILDGMNEISIDFNESYLNSELSNFKGRTKLLILGRNLLNKDEFKCYDEINLSELNDECLNKIGASENILKLLHNNYNFSLYNEIEKYDTNVEIHTSFDLARIYFDYVIFGKFLYSKYANSDYELNDIYNALKNRDSNFLCFSSHKKEINSLNDLFLLLCNNSVKNKISKKDFDIEQKLILQEMDLVNFDNDEPFFTSDKIKDYFIACFCFNALNSLKIDPNNYKNFDYVVSYALWQNNSMYKEDVIESFDAYIRQHEEKIKKTTLFEYYYHHLLFLEEEWDMRFFDGDYLFDKTESDDISLYKTWDDDLDNCIKIYNNLKEKQLSNDELLAHISRIEDLLYSRKAYKFLIKKEYDLAIIEYKKIKNSFDMLSILLGIAFCYSFLNLKKSYYYKNKAFNLYKKTYNVDSIINDEFLEYESIVKPEELKHFEKNVINEFQKKMIIKRLKVGEYKSSEYFNLICHLISVKEIENYNEFIKEINVDFRLCFDNIPVIDCKDNFCDFIKEVIENNRFDNKGISNLEKIIDKGINVLCHNNLFLIDSEVVDSKVVDLKIAEIFVKYYIINNFLSCDVKKDIINCKQKTITRDIPLISLFEFNSLIFKIIENSGNQMEELFNMQFNVLKGVCIYLNKNALNLSEQYVIAIEKLLIDLFVSWVVYIYKNLFTKLKNMDFYLQQLCVSIKYNTKIKLEDILDEFKNNTIEDKENTLEILKTITEIWNSI